MNLLKTLFCNKKVSGTYPTSRLSKVFNQTIPDNDFKKRFFSFDAFLTQILWQMFKLHRRKNLKVSLDLHKWITNRTNISLCQWFYPFASLQAWWKKHRNELLLTNTFRHMESLTFKIPLKCFKLVLQLHHTFSYAVNSVNKNKEIAQTLIYIFYQILFKNCIQFGYIIVCVYTFKTSKSFVTTSLFVSGKFFQIQIFQNSVYFSLKTKHS